MLLERVTATSGVFRALLLAGLILRVACLPLRGTGDMEVWKTWSYAATLSVSTMYGVGGQPPERGIVTWGARHMTVDYPPGALYGLAIVGRVYRAIDPAFTDGAGLTIAIKLAILLGDAAACFGVWALMRRISATAGRTAALFYWLNPATIMDGAVLGYLDPWYGALAMAALLAVDGGAFAWGGAVLAVAVLTKPQALLIMPVFGLLLLHRADRTRWKAAVAAALAAAATSAALLAPFARIGAMANVRQGVGSLLRHDMLSAEMSNLWWIVTWILRSSYGATELGAWAAWTAPVRILGISRAVALGYPNARVIGTALASSLMLWGFWRARRGPLPIVLAAGAFAIHAYTVLSVQVHENHFYLALPLMAAAGAVLPRMRAPFALASTVCVLNLFLFQGLGRDFAIHSRGLTIVDATVLLSFVNVAALVWHARRFSEQAAGPAAVHLDRHAGDV